MKVFTFEGTSTIKRKFKAEVVANTYEEAEEQALVLLEDTDDSAHYTLGSDDVEIEVTEYAETNLSQYARENRYEYL